MFYKSGYRERKRKILLVSGVALVAIAVSLLAIGNMGDTKTTVTGQFIATNGCKGVVGGTLITDYGAVADMCEKAEKLDGKTVEVTGWVYEHECKKGEECFVGPYMRKIEEIRILG